MSELAPVIKQRFFDSNGDPLSGGFLYSYAAGTTTPLATFVDGTGVTPNTNPVVLDAEGYCNVWLGPNAYKFVLTDSQGVVQFTEDNIQSVESQIDQIVASITPYIKTTMSYTQFQTSSTHNAVAAFSIPAGFILKDIILKHSTNFIGTSITAVNAQVGPSGSPDQILPDLDIFQSVGDGAFGNVPTGFIGSFANPTPVLVNLVSVGANLSALSQGSLDIYYKYEKFTS